MLGFFSAECPLCLGVFLSTYMRLMHKIMVFCNLYDPK
jgi:hypothetical protein